jgi:hypothetical protein
VVATQPLRAADERMPEAVPTLAATRSGQHAAPRRLSRALLAGVIGSIAVSALMVWMPSSAAPRSSERRSQAGATGEGARQPDEPAADAGGPGPRATAEATLPRAPSADVGARPPQAPSAVVEARLPEPPSAVVEARLSQPPSADAEARLPQAPTAVMEAKLPSAPSAAANLPNAPPASAGASLSDTPHAPLSTPRPDAAVSSATRGLAAPSGARQAAQRAERTISDASQTEPAPLPEALPARSKGRSGLSVRADEF